MNRFRQAHFELMELARLDPERLHDNLFLIAPEYLELAVPFISFYPNVKQSNSAAQESTVPITSGLLFNGWTNHLKTACYHD